MPVIDQGTMMIFIVLMIVGIAIGYVLKMIMGSHPKVQRITKDQLERLSADSLTSAKNNRIRRNKWINFTGDSTHPAMKHYAKVIGTNYDARVAHVWWKVKWFSKKRQALVPFALLENIDGKELWVKANGFMKDGYFMRPILCRDMIVGGQTWEKYDDMIDSYIQILLHIQGKQDMGEQISFETIAAASHDQRTQEELFSRPEYPRIEEEPRDFTEEPQG